MIRDIALSLSSGLARDLRNLDDKRYFHGLDQDGSELLVATAARDTDSTFFSVSVVALDGASNMFEVL